MLPSPSRVAVASAHTDSVVGTQEISTRRFGGTNMRKLHRQEMDGNGVKTTVTELTPKK